MNPLSVSIQISQTRSSAIAEEPRDALCQLKSCQQYCCTAVRKLTFEKACIRRLNIADNTYCIARGVRIRKVSNSKSYLLTYLRSLVAIR